MFEVQTYTWCDGWVNCWTIDDNKPEYFNTEREAEEAIDEFFDDLYRAGMRDQYDRQDYRVVEVDKPSPNREN